MEITLANELKDAEKWACCDWPGRAIRAKYKITELQRSLEWYKTRLEAMQQWQSVLPEPYRTECCDILANGKIAPWRQMRSSS